MTAKEGLQIRNQGLAGFIVEMTSDFDQACARFERVAAYLDAPEVRSPPGGLILLSLPADLALLHSVSVAHAIERGWLYFDRRLRHCLEWPMHGGWVDRRVVPDRLVQYFCENRGCAVSLPDRRWAKRKLSELLPEWAGSDSIEGFIKDAQAWWYLRMTGPLFAHSTRMKPFQLLPASALARGSAALPVLNSSSAPAIEHLRLRFEATHHQTDSMAMFDSLIRQVGQIARSRASKPSGREKIDAFIQSRLDEAARDGRAQLLALAAIGHAHKAGGMRGFQLAPVSFYEYMRLRLRDLVKDMVTNGLERDGAKWFETYSKLFEGLAASQRSKLAAFLHVFHRAVVIFGYEPLPRSLIGKHDSLPPAAAVVWPHELKLAVEFVRGHGSHWRTRLQATLCLLIAWEIPIRSIELFCIRMSDFQEDEPMSLTVHPRQRDGVCKASSTIRMEDLKLQATKLAVLSFWRLRRHTDHAVGDGDLLFGTPGNPEVRWEQAQTMRLVNAALKWATGDKAASLYDLRHTVVTRRAVPLLKGA